VLPRAERLPYFVGFSTTLWIVTLLATAVGYLLAGMVPEPVTLGLVFLTPIYFMLILAAEIGAYIVSPFLGRIDDAAADGMHALRQMCEIYDVQGYETEVLAASLRHPMHVVEAALAGANIATMPYDVFVKLVKHPLTDAGLQKFTQDWEALQRELKGGA